MFVATHSSKQNAKDALQGVAGSIPFQALVFFTLYFQLLGFSNFAASALMSGFLFATAFGGLLGGWIGDKSVLFFNPACWLPQAKFLPGKEGPVASCASCVLHVLQACCCLLEAALQFMRANPGRVRAMRQVKGQYGQPDQASQPDAECQLPWA